MKLNVNGKEVSVESPGETPLLWVLRDELNLTGTKFGCGKALCGSCTVHVNGEAVRSCSYPVKLAANQQVTTIEGVVQDHGDKVSACVVQAWTENSVPQCGYCQSGQIMTAVKLLKEIPNPTDENIDQAMSGNICRCGTYQRIRAAIHHAANKARA